MSLKSELTSKTTGTNRIEMTSSVIKDLSFEPRVKNSRVILVSKAEYGFWRWKDASRTTKENCDPGDWIVVDGVELSFKNQANFDSSAYGMYYLPSIDSVVFY